MSGEFNFERLNELCQRTSRSRPGDSTNGVCRFWHAREDPTDGVRGMSHSVNPTAPYELVSPSSRATHDLWLAIERLRRGSAPDIRKAVRTGVDGRALVRYGRAARGKDCRNRCRQRVADERAERGLEDAPTWSGAVGPIRRPISQVGAADNSETPSRIFRNQPIPETEARTAQRPSAESGA